MWQIGGRGACLPQTGFSSDISACPSSAGSEASFQKSAEEEDRTHLLVLNAVQS